VLHANYLNHNEKGNENIMINLYRKAMQAVHRESPNWYAAYKDICEKVRAVNDWNNPEEASDALLKRVIYDTDNGVSSAGQAFNAWPLPRPNVGRYRNLLNQLKDVQNSRYPSDEVARCRKDFFKITRGRGSAIFNRIVSAFQPGVVSPVMFEAAFDSAWRKLVQGGYIDDSGFRVQIGDDGWYTKNTWLMERLREVLPDGQCDGGAIDIDNYSRGTFVWGVHKYINMDDWIIIRDRVLK
jgi:hypothetical protein